MLTAVVQDLLDVVPGELVDESHLVGVHEAGVAHHVAAVGEIEGQNRASAVLDGGASVIVKVFVVVGPDVTAGERLFEMAEEIDIDGHDVLEMPVLRTILDHQDLTVALDDLRLDLSDLLSFQNVDVDFAVQNLVAGLRNANGAERVGRPGPTEGRFGLLPGFLKRLVRPGGRERRIGADAVQTLESEPSPLCCVG